MAARPTGGASFPLTTVHPLSRPHDPADHPRARGRRRRAHRRRHRGRRWRGPARARSSRPRAAGSSASCRRRAASGRRSRRGPRIRWRCSFNVRRLAKLCLDEGVALVHARSRAPGLGRARRRAGAGPALRDDLPRQLCRTLVGQAPLQLGDGARRCRHRQLALYGGPHPLALSAGRGADPRHPPRHRSRRYSRPPRSRPSGSRRCARPGASPRTSASCCSPPASPGWKGQKVLIEAAAKLKRRGIADVVFVLAGDPQGRDGYVRDLDAPSPPEGLKDVVRRVGHCTDMPAAFLAASVVTVPSTEPEAFGRVAVEAQAMGTPVVRRDLGAVPETVLTPPRGGAAGADRLAGAAGRRRRPSPRRLSTALTLGASAREAMATRARASCRAAFLARADGVGHARCLCQPSRARPNGASRVDLSGFRANCPSVRVSQVIGGPAPAD